MSHVTLLGGGSETTRLLVGLLESLPEEQLQVVVNTGNDCEIWGLYACPDTDSLLHALAGEYDPYREEIPSEETFQCMNTIRKLGVGGGLRIGDRGLATLLLRSHLLRAGASLEEATAELADRFGLGVTIMPASNDPVRTRIQTAEETLTVLEYLERGDEQPAVTGVTYEGASEAKAPDQVIRSIRDASRVILAPSDPISSIGPILCVPGIREALVNTPAAVVAVSPAIGSQPVSQGQPDLMKATRGESMTARAVAEGYRDFLNHIVIHTTDVSDLDRIRELGVGTWVENILMSNADDGRRLAGRLIHEGRFAAQQTV